MNLNQKITQLRNDNNWSQEELAEKLNVSRQSVSKWESGQSKPDLDKIVVLSNTTNSTKIKKICSILDINYIKFACKPLFFGFYKIKKMYNISYNNMCMIGDQILTDIYGANNLGINSCLIEKISNVEGRYTKFKRKIEKIIEKKLKKKYNFERGKYYD